MKAYHIMLAAALCGMTAGEKMGESAGQGQAAQPMPPFKVGVMPLEQRTVELKSTWFGHLRGLRQANISPQVSGTLLTQFYQDGSLCKKGEVLFEIDPATYQAAVDLQKANLSVAKAAKAQAEVALSRAQDDKERYDKLVKTGAVSVKQHTDAIHAYKQSEAALVQAKANIELAEAALKNAEINLERTKIVAPFEGFASKAAVSHGDFLAAGGQVLCTLSSINPIRVDFSVTGKQVLSWLKAWDMNTATGKMENMPKFEVILEDGTIFKHQGQFTAGVCEVSRSTGAVNFMGYIPYPEYKLRAGMAVRIRAVTSTYKDAMLVPVRSILSAMSRRSVVVVAPDKTPVAIPVIPGETVSLEMPDGMGGKAPMLMQIVTGAVKPLPEVIKELGYQKAADVPVVVEGSQMAGMYSKANYDMKRAGLKGGFGTLNPEPFIYTAPGSTAPSITAEK